VVEYYILLPVPLPPYLLSPPRFSFFLSPLFPFPPLSFLFFTPSFLPFLFTFSFFFLPLFPPFLATHWPRLVGKPVLEESAQVGADLIGAEVVLPVVDRRAPQTHPPFAWPPPRGCEDPLGSRTNPASPVACRRADCSVIVPLDSSRPPADVVELTGALFLLTTDEPFPVIAPGSGLSATYKQFGTVGSCRPLSSPFSLRSFFFSLHFVPPSLHCHSGTLHCYPSCFFLPFLHCVFRFVTNSG